MSYSKTRLLIQIKLMKTAGKEIHQEAEGMLPKTTRMAMKRIILDLDEIEAVARSIRNDNRTNALPDKGNNGDDHNGSTE